MTAKVCWYASKACDPGRVSPLASFLLRHTVIHKALSKDIVKQTT